MPKEPLKQTPAPQNNAPRDWAILAIRLASGGVFVTAGFFTILEPSAYLAATMEGYKLIPASWTLPAAHVLPWIEFFLGGFLLSGYFTRISLIGISSLLALFLIAVGSVLARGINLDNCGCFGEGFHMSPLHTLIMDALLLSACLWALRVKKTPILSLDSWIEKGR